MHIVEEFIPKILYSKHETFPIKYIYKMYFVIMIMLQMQE